MGLLEKKIISDIEKSRSGVYQNTSENRRLHRVGQRYGVQEKKEISNESSNKSKTNTYITPENSEGYVRNLNKVLDKKGYFAHATRTGGIEIYKKGDRKSLGNLKASIIATDYINWGPNEGLRGRLEPVIKEALSSTTFSGGKVENKDENKSDSSKEIDKVKKLLPKPEKQRVSLSGWESSDLSDIKEYGEGGRVISMSVSPQPDLKNRRYVYSAAVGKTNIPVDSSDDFMKEAGELKEKLFETPNEAAKAADEFAEKWNKSSNKDKKENVKTTDAEESFTRVKFDDIPESGKVNLKKYLTGKRKLAVDERWGKISEISTSNLQKTHDELVKKFNSDFESSKKSQRAEDLYNIMKVKNELSKRK